MKRRHFRQRTGVLATTLSILAAGCLLIGATKPACAYESDTHYMMTLIQCQAMGLSFSDALVVATYDQGMDDSSDTVANGGLGGLIPNVPEEHLWHSIPQTGTAKEVLERKQVLWNRVVAEKDPKAQLQRLGVFFHYQQDTWAHRHHNNSSLANFSPYQTPTGHAEDGHQPDRPPFDPVCALRCLEDGLGYVRQFITVCKHGTPNSLFDNYQPAVGAVDSNWSRKGKYFNQIVADNSTPAHRFVTDLIRSQVSAYKSSMSVGVFFPGRDTADSYDPKPMRESLLAACSRSQISASMPEKRQELKTLKTAQLEGKDFGSHDYVVRVHTGTKSGAGTDSNIFLSMQGTDGFIGEQRLNGFISGNAFENGDTNTLTLHNLESVGELNTITVRSDDKWLGSDWYLEWIEISGPGMTTRHFTFNSWFKSGQLTQTKHF